MVEQMYLIVLVILVSPRQSWLTVI